MGIFQAIRDNDLSAIHQLLERDPTIHRARDERGSTPLLLASYLGHQDATKVLVEAGADLDVCGATGTALMGVCFKGYEEIARYLLDAGADANVRHANGATALIFAAMFNKESIVELLLNRGADAGAKDATGLTAAMHAKKQGFGALAERISRAASV